ncbi:MAG: hypothetical protein ACKO9X_09280 [Dolichospermum sp.]
MSKNHTALTDVMRYTTGGQDAHPTRVLLLKFVPHSNGICCKIHQSIKYTT